MNILMYSSGFDGCGKYRLEIPAKYLNKDLKYTAKISTKYDKNDIRWADIIVLQKQIDERVFEFIKYAKSLGKKVITEVDDHYFSLESHNPAYIYYYNKHEILKKFYRESDAITVTTEHLRKVLLPYNNNIYVLPNSLDLNEVKRILSLPKEKINQYTRYQFKNKSNVSQEEVERFLKNRKSWYWSGSPTHFADLQICTKAIIDFCKNNKDVVFIFGGCATEEIINNVSEDQLLLIKPVPIFQYSYVMASIKADVAFCPITDSEFNKSKSNLKILENSVYARPCIASDVENYSKTISHMENGILTKNTYNDWYQSFEHMKDLILIDKLGKNMQQTITEKYDISKNIEMWKNCYNEILKK